MKKLDTSAVSTTNGLPVKAGSLVHVQSAYTEIIEQIIRGECGNAYSDTTPYIVTGLGNTTAATGASIPAGSIFLGGEVYLVDAFTMPATANASLSTTYFTDISADPVGFTDGVQRNIHQIRKIVFGATTGLGFTFKDTIRVGEPATTFGSPTTITFAYPRTYFRSLQANPASSFTITLDDTGIRDGVECLFVVQSAGTAVTFTHNLTGFLSAMGIGGYSNPLTITVATNKFFVIKYRAFATRTSAGQTTNNVSIEVVENT